MTRRRTLLRNSVLGTFWVLALFCGPGILQAQSPPPETPPTPSTDGPSSQTRSLLQDLYRQVYELQLELSRVDSEVDRQRLEIVRSDLLRRIESVRDRVAKMERDQGEGDGAADSSGFGAIASELEKMGIDADWEYLGKIFQDNAQTLGRSLTEIGRQLEKMSVDVDEERSRIRIDTGQGGKFSFTVPEDVQKEIRRGIAQMGVELQRVLADSSGGSLPAEVRALLNEFPEGMRRSWRLERSVPRHVVARNVFKSFDDFEVAEDEIIAGDLIVIGGDAYVAGEVRGNIWVLFGDVLVEGQGEVAKDAISVGGEVVVEDDARVMGSRFDAASFIPGIGIGWISPHESSHWLLHTVRVGVLALLALVGFALAGDRISTMVDHSSRAPGRDLLAGALWFPMALGAFVVSSVGLAISVIGIPVVIVLAAAFGTVLLLAYFSACLYLGRRFFELFADRDGRPDWVYALLGLGLLEMPAVLVLSLAAATDETTMVVGVQVVDYLLKFLALALGFGSLVATRLGGRPPERTPEGSGVLPAPSDL